MKALVCEMCNGTNLAKQDGFFVCQNCEVKYSVDEAKKMMSDGVTVQIDSSGKLKNWYQLARRAKDDNNAEDAAKYYDLIRQEDPNSWEAAYFVIYYRAMQCIIKDIQRTANTVDNCIKTVLKLIKEQIPEQAEKENAVHEVSIRSIHIASMLYEGAERHLKEIPWDHREEYKSEFVDRALACADIVLSLGNHIDEIFAGEMTHNLGCCATAAWGKAAEWMEHIASKYGLYVDKKALRGMAADCRGKIQKYAPPPPPPAQQAAPAQQEAPQQTAPAPAGGSAEKKPLNIKLFAIIGAVAVAVIIGIVLLATQLGGGGGGGEHALVGSWESALFDYDFEADGTGAVWVADMPAAARFSWEPAGPGRIRMNDSIVFEDGEILYYHFSGDFMVLANRRLNQTELAEWSEDLRFSRVGE